MIRSGATGAPGDTILLSDGVWRDLRLTLHRKGPEDEPITIRPANEGNTTIEGESALELVAEHVVLERLVIKNRTSRYGQSLRLEENDCRAT